MLTASGRIESSRVIYITHGGRTSRDTTNANAQEPVVIHERLLIKNTPSTWHGGTYLYILPPKLLYTGVV